MFFFYNQIIKIHLLFQILEKFPGDHQTFKILTILRKKSKRRH